jgi:hypothetical protein
MKAELKNGKSEKMMSGRAFDGSLGEHPQHQ